VESGQGFIELSGEARVLIGEEARNRAKGLPPLQGRFRLIASKLPIPIGPGQRLVLSGDTQVLADAQSLRWVGKLLADEGLIELRSAGVPDLPSDVVILRPGSKEKNDTKAIDPGSREGLARAASAQIAALTQDSPLRLGAELDIDLGKNLRVIGGGVDARLEGVLSLKGILPQQPRAVGLVTVKEGTYLAYGQKLEVTRGVLRFQGELDNPALDLVALRRFLPVEPGVQVTGTALSPRVKLTSSPEVSDAEKLSWLVLGTGIDDNRTGTQTLALQQAAFSLLGNEEGGLSSSIAKVFGLDVITLGTSRSAAPSEVIGRGLGPLGTNASQAVSNASVQQNVLTIGKRLSSRVFLSYEQGLRGVWNLLRIQYDISNRLSIRAQTGSENAVDLLLFHWFD
jgi:translocation and assembly module TamB